MDLTPGPGSWTPTCRNCRRPIKEQSTARFGWTHEGDWQGQRCAGAVTGAVPDVRAAYRAGREDAARDIEALCDCEDSGLNLEQREALRRHGYNPDLWPRGIGGPPGEFPGRVPGVDGKYVDGLIRNHVCALDGIEIDGHEGSDLDPGSTSCLHCDYEGPNP